MTGPAPVARAFERAALYRLSATALAPPSRESLAEVARLAAAAAKTAPAALRTLVEGIAREARVADPEALALAHVALFDGRAACVPYEGAYGPPQLAGKSARLADIAGFYRAFGLEPSGRWPEVEDHIAAELEFMAALALKEAWALAEGHDERAAIACDAAARFLADHLAPWAGSFAEALIAADPPAFHTAAAELLRAWVEADAAAHDVRVSPLAARPGEPDGDAPFTCPMARAGEAAEHHGEAAKAGGPRGGR